MATITKPMALDESFNTTESTSRNQADVLVGIEQAIVRGFGQVANAVSYDNTDSGLTADNVQDAIDEVDDTVDGLVDDVAEISSDIESTQTVSGNPITLTDAAPINAESLVVELEPKQDLHGYDYPWVGGARKNKMPLDLAKIKSSNTVGNWSGNAYYIYGVTFTVNTDDGGNVTGINIDGTLTSDYVDFLLDGNTRKPLEEWGLTIGTTYILSGNRDGAHVIYNGVVANITSGTFTADTSDSYFPCIRITQITYNNVLIQPMVCLASAQNPTVFEKWSNICPITGYTECEVDDVGKNLWGGIKFAQDIKDKKSDSVLDTANKTIEPSGFEPYVQLYSNFKANTQYTFILRASTAASSKGTNLRVAYTDNTFNDLFLDATANGKLVYVSTSGKTISYIGTVGQDTPPKLLYDECGLFEGVITLDEFVPYSPTSATIQFGQTVYGGRSNFTDGGTDDEWNKDDTFSGWYKSSTETSVIIKEITDKKGGTNQIYCNTYKYVANQGFGVPLGAISDSTNSSYTKYVFVNDSRFAGKTIQECQAILESDGMYFVYQVETPTQLSTSTTPLKLLKGTNNITTNGTTINLGYQPDNVIGHTLEVAEDYTDRAVGKNILPMTLAGIKAANPHLTWTDETSFTSGNVTVTFQVAGGDIYGIHIVSTGSNGEFFNLCFDGVDYSRFDGCILSGCDVNDENKIYIAIRKYGGANYFAKNISGDTVINYTAGQKASIFVYLSSGSVDTVLKPMIRKPNMDNTYEPPKPSKEILMDLIAYLFTQI